MLKKFKGIKLSLVGLSLAVALAGCSNTPKDEAKKLKQKKQKKW